MHFFPKNLKIFPKLADSLRIGKKKTSATWAFAEEKQYKEYEKRRVLFDGHPSIERGKFFKLLFGILYGAALEPEGIRQFDV